MRRVRVTGKTSLVVAGAIRFILDTVANTATNAERTRIADDTASVSIWRPPLTPRDNVSAKWDGSDRNAINVSFLFLFY